MFPPGNSGGPIEARSRWRGRVWRPRGFRRVIPAAPLKRVARAEPRIDVARFPPGNSGGPIEAAREAVAAAPRLVRFPPGNSGGPIEAVVASSLIDLLLTGFRRVIPAAPLKLLFTFFSKSSSCFCFRRVIPAAPLKHPSGGGVRSSRLAFPPANSGGPIEATSQDPCGSPSTSRFRRVIPAAPLKQGQCR